jgi:hypothetical protein
MHTSPHSLIIRAARHAARPHPRARTYLASILLDTAPALVVIPQLPIVVIPQRSVGICFYSIAAPTADGRQCFSSVRFDFPIINAYFIFFT